MNDINSGKSTLSEPGDMTVIGNSLPRLQYGINFGISYAGFDLSVMLQGVGKRDWMYTGELLYTFAAGDAKWYPVFEGTTDYWKPISTDPTSPDYMQPVNRTPSCRVSTARTAVRSPTPDRTAVQTTTCSATPRTCASRT